MKKVSKLLHLVLGFSAGLLAGAFIRLGFEIIHGRPAAIGGEVLVLPLVILLVCFGFVLGKEVKVQKSYDWTYRKGFWEGYESGLQDGITELQRHANLQGIPENIQVR